MLKNLLNTEVVQVVEQGHDLLACLLIQRASRFVREQNGGSIEPRYVDAIYHSHDTIGPYYVVGPGIAMPHARPEEGANKLSLALTLIPSGVNFDADENDPVKLLIVLAATDSTSHIEAISQLAKLFDNEKDIQAILTAKTTQDILSVIARY